MSKKAVPKTSLKPALPDVTPRFPYALILSISVVWALVVLFKYQQKLSFFSISPFDAPLWLTYIGEAGRIAAYLPQIAYALMFAVFAFFTGGILLNLVAGSGNEDIGELEWFFFSLGLGYGALALLILGMGFLGLYNKYAIFSLMGLGMIAGAVRFRADFNVRLRGMFLAISGIRFSWLDRFFIFTVLLYSATAFIWALSPEIFFDALVYHLGVPDYYLREGRVAAMSSNICSGFPLLVQMIYTAGIIISDDILAKLIHFSLGMLLMGTLFAAGRRYLSVSAGVLAGIIFLSIPMVVLNMATTGMDVGSCWFTMLAAYSLLLFSAREKAAEPRVFDRTLLLAGIFTGFACGTKYQAMFALIAGFAILIYRYFSAAGPRDARLAVKQALFFGTVACLVFAPWPFKNILFHGNPLYPFFGKIFGGQQVDPLKWAILLSDGFSRNLPATFSSWNEFLQFALHPWHLTFNGMGNADFIGPFILICLPLFLMFRLKKPAFRHMAVFVAVMWLLWAVSTSMPRFFLQGLTVMSVLLSVMIMGSGNSWLKWFFQLVLAVVSLYSFQWLNKIEQSQDGWRVVFGLQDRADYLSRQHSTYPSPYYPAMKYINAELPRDSRVLFAGETRGFYCERRFIAPSVNDVHLLVLFARQSSTPEEMQAKMSAAGITHIFLNLAEALRLDRSYQLFQWDERSIAVFNAWWDRYARLVWSDTRNAPGEFRLLFVYRIAAAPGTPPDRNYFKDLYVKSLKERAK